MKTEPRERQIRLTVKDTVSVSVVDGVRNSVIFVGKFLRFLYFLLLVTTIIKEVTENKI